MLITTQPIKQYTQSIHLDIPYSFDEILNEIKLAELVPIYDNRSKFGISHNTKLGDIRQAIIDYNFMDKFFETYDFKLLWNNMSPEELKSKVEFGCTGYCDKPGFSLCNHVDSRQIVIVGMIFLNPTNDILQNTILHDTEDMKNPQYLPSSLGDGWVMANAHNTWHLGGNLSKQDRYSIMFNYTL